MFGEGRKLSRIANIIELISLLMCSLPLEYPVYQQNRALDYGKSLSLTRGNCVVLPSRYSDSINSTVCPAVGGASSAEREVIRFDLRPLP